MAAEEKSLVTVSQQVVRFASGLSVRQKILLAGGAVVVAALLLVFVRFMSKPDMKPLYSQMDPAEAQSLLARLEARKIQAQLSPDGTGVSVAADQLDAARMETASQPLPQRGRMGFELFDRTNWTSTDFDDKVNYQRALEGELERTVQTLDGVSSCRVHLALPAETIFTERERHAKATVVLHLRRGTMSTATQVAITRLLAGAVDDLQPENVSVIDAETNRALNASMDSALGDSLGHSADEMLAQRLVRTLEPVVGEGRIRASVRVEYDANSSEENQETYDPNSVVALASQKSEQRTGSGLAAGVPGTASNLGGKAVVDNSGSDSSLSKSENATYAANRTTRHTLHPAGQVKRITAALLVDDSVSLKEENGKQLEARQPRSADQLKKIEELARATLALDPARGDAISVQNISFTAAAPLDITKPTITQRVRVLQNDYASLLRIAAVFAMFLFVYLVAIRPVKSQILRSFRTMQAPQKALPVEPRKVDAAPPIELPDASPELKTVGELTKRLKDKVKSEPVSSARLVQTWIRDGEVKS